MPTKSSPFQYTKDDLQSALRRIQKGEKAAAVSRSVGIPPRTLARYVALVRRGKNTDLKRSGPEPRIGTEAESHLYDWVLAMQSLGSPVQVSDVIQKANQIAQVLGVAAVTHGWYKRFIDRHPDIVPRVAETVTRARAEISKDGVETLFRTINTLITKYQLDASRIYNCDETAFNPKPRTGKVLAKKGSSNVWGRCLAQTYHLSFVACVSASGHVVPPLMLIPGQRLPIDETREALATLPSAAVTGTPKGYINSEAFNEWLQFFSNAIPGNVARPILLTFDGYRAHLSPTIVDTALDLGILLVCLPANATHIFQPLDVAVFGPFKRVLKKLVKARLLETHRVSISKAEAIKLGCQAWITGMRGENSAAGFRACGLYPLSKEVMLQRLDKFNSGGLSQTGAPYSRPDWIKYKDKIVDELLTIPRFEPGKKRCRKTVDVSGLHVTHALLNEPPSN